MKKFKWNRFCTIFVLLMFITVTYASFNTNLFINGTGYVRVDKDIRITNIRLLEVENNGYENVNSEYSVDSVSMDVSLPKQASSVTYEATISNVSDKRYKITDILESSYNNKDVKYELVDASIGNIVEPHTTKTFKVRFTNNIQIVEEDDVYETKEYTFDYTGGEQEFIVPYDGEYTLEVWGASGGNINSVNSKGYTTADNLVRKGGYGGYSTGKIKLKKNQKIYINVGGTGKFNIEEEKNGIPGGYNGGGSSYGLLSKGSTLSRMATSGGGATHIATVKGILSKLENDKDSILIVAGGGAGTWYFSSAFRSIRTGSAGGYIGGSGEDSRTENVSGGTQDGAGESGHRIATFGKGAGTPGYEQCGGGGGFYGGNSSYYSGAGGSSYIGNTNLKEKSMYCYNCEESSENTTKTISTENHSATPTSNYAKEGNGYAKITFTRKVEDGTDFDFDYTGGEQTFTVPYSGVYQLETWGAQGGNATLYSTERTGYGGYGGYAVGKINLAKNEVIYINNGGKGGSESYINGVEKHDDNTGYNGGGSGHQYYQVNHINSLYGGGGGASHMAFVSGKLSELEAEMGTLYKDNSTYNSKNIIIVAGGGGGSASHGGFPSYSGNGGSGGGYIAGEGEALNNRCYCYGEGGNQLNGGIGHICDIDGHSFFKSGLFGYAPQHTSYSIDTSARCGGGGGWFGGTSAEHGASGGGSGYIGNSKLYEKTMYCYKCKESKEQNTKTVTTQAHSEMPKQFQAKEGNGYSRITLIKRTVNQTKLTLDFTFKEYLNGNEYTFSYTGEPQTFTVPKTGYYKVELWGASGNNTRNDYVSQNPSYGGYTSGKIKLQKGEKLNVYVGGKEKRFNSTTATAGGISGGATDIRLKQGANWYDLDSLSSRIMVAGGAGQTYNDGSAASGGNAGGLHSYGFDRLWGVNITSQTIGGLGTKNESTDQFNYQGGDGSFGIGGTPINKIKDEGVVSGWGYHAGAGGYYGGGGGPSGGGGSSFISGHNGCVAIKAESDTTPRNDSSGNQCVDGTTDITCSYHYSNYKFTDTKMIDGKGYQWTTEVGTEVVGMPTHDGTSTMNGNDGDGFAKITLLEETPEYEFDYTGDVQTFTAPYNGIYKIQLWGAQGGNVMTNDTNKGGYTSGEIELKRNQKIYLYVGSKGGVNTPTANAKCEFNGGGTARIYSYNNTTYKQGTGGGATDIRLVNGTWDNFDSLKSRIMVAGAGGGSHASNELGGPGGGLNGYQGVMKSNNELTWGEPGTGGTQIAGGYAECARSSGGCAEWGGDYEPFKHFGIGGFGYGGTSPQIGSAGGGSGYFGGGSSMHSQSGGGGSSYISGHPGCVSITKDSTEDNITFINNSNGTACNDTTSSGYNASGYNTDSACNKHYSGYTFSDTVMIDGQGYKWDSSGKSADIVGMPSHDGRSTMIGNVGNGYAKITLVEKKDTYKINYDLDGGTLKNKRNSYSTFDSDITLGTPTKEGYTFIGWLGGKNLLDLTKFERGYYSYNSGNVKQFVAPNSSDGYSTSRVSMMTTLKAGTYIFSFPSAISLRVDDFTGDVYTRNLVAWTDTTEVKTLTLNSDTLVTITFGRRKSEADLLLTDFQNFDILMEEGSEKTDYEPYISTATKNLVIPKGSNGNRAYKANWIKNYSVEYNLDGGRISNQKTIYNINTESFTLPNPAKTNYTFNGWTGGKNLIDISGFTNDEISGVTRVFDKDNGTITVNGTATNWANILLLQLTGDGQYYTLSGGPQTDRPNGIFLSVHRKDDAPVAADVVRSVNESTPSFYAESRVVYNVYACINNGYEYKNVVYKPQLEKGENFTGFEKYIYTPTNNITIAKGSSGNRIYTANWVAN